MQKKYKAIKIKEEFPCKSVNEYLIVKPITNASEAINNSDTGDPNTVNPLNIKKIDAIICNLRNKKTEVNVMLSLFTVGVYIETGVSPLAE